MPEIVAGVVLRQALIKAQQLAGAGHDLHASYPAAGHAVTNHLNAAGIRRYVAADLARAR